MEAIFRIGLYDECFTRIIVSKNPEILGVI